MPDCTIIVLIVAAVTSNFQGVTPVHITGLAVPPVVMNGSMSSLVLDCIYKLDSPNNTASGLVVKWYHNRGHSPVYQWIPGYPPQAFGMLRRYVNLTFVASEDVLTRQREIQLLQPRPELSGEFTCKVTTWSGVASATKRMTIYAPVKYLALVSLRASKHQMTLNCRASGVCPEPEVTMYVQGSKEIRNELRDSQVTKELVDGTYTIDASRELDDRDIPARCLVFCRLTLPYTAYLAEEKIPHIRGAASFPGAPVFARRERLTGRSHWSQTSSTSLQRPSDWLHTALLLRLMWQLAAR